MSWSKLSNEERLHLWKQFRIDTKGLPFDDQLEKIAEFCSVMPNGRRTLDYYSPAEWPTPWEIIFHGEFCKSSISLLIFYTLTLLNNREQIELWVVKDNECDYLLPVIDNRFILNYEPGKVSKHSDVSEYFIVMQKFSKDQIKIIT